MCIAEIGKGPRKQGGNRRTLIVNKGRREHICMERKRRDVKDQNNVEGYLQIGEEPSFTQYS